jgi:hypothetical protein
VIYDRRGVSQRIDPYHEADFNAYFLAGVGCGFHMGAAYWRWEMTFNEMVGVMAAALAVCASFIIICLSQIGDELKKINEREDRRDKEKHK